MKKFICLLLALLILSSCAALAAGKIEIRRQSLFIDPDGGSNYYFAELENTGDKQVYVGNGVLTIQDSSGNELLNKNVYVMGMNPALQPGETMYVNEYIYEKFSDADISSFNCTFKSESWGTEYTRVPCVSELNLSTDGSSINYVYVTVPNDTDETIYGYYVTVAVNSTEGQLVFSNCVISTDIGIDPHSSVTARILLNSALVKYLKNNDIELADIQAELMY